MCGKAASCIRSRFNVRWVNFMQESDIRAVVLDDLVHKESFSDIRLLMYRDS